MTCVQVDQALHHHGDTSTQLSVGQADMSPMLDDVRLGMLCVVRLVPNIAKHRSHVWARPSRRRWALAARWWWWRALATSPAPSPWRSSTSSPTLSSAPSAPTPSSCSAWPRTPGNRWSSISRLYFDSFYSILLTIDQRAVRGDGAQHV